MAARRKPAPKSKKKRSPSRKSTIERHHLDLLGLGLVAISVFFAFVIWLDWDGGRVGDAAVEGMQWVVGGLHVAAPLALLVAGGWLVLQPVLPAVRPVRTGLIAGFLGIETALAAGTLGMGPGGTRLANFDVPFAKEHGGMVGEAMFAGISALLGTVGVHIVALFLLLAAVLLLTGASIASMVQATGTR